MKRNDKKIFYDQYLNGEKDFYSMTYGEIEDAVGRNEAEQIWNDDRWIDFPDSITYDQIINYIIFKKIYTIMYTH